MGMAFGKGYVMSGLLQSALGELRVCHAASAAVAWVSEQVAAYMPGWLASCAPVAEGACWQVLKVRLMGDHDSYHWLFDHDHPEEHEIRLVVFSNCGNSLYRLDVVSFDADRLGAQIEVVPMRSYRGEALLS
mgnify:CR=1 FL=1